MIFMICTKRNDQVEAEWRQVAGLYEFKSAK